MSFISDFIHQKVPKPGTEIPAYYRTALTVCEQLLMVYFPLSFFLLSFVTQRWQLLPAALFAATVGAFLSLKRLGVRANLCLYSALLLVWTTWYVYMFGWGVGVQHLLVPLLVLIFFDIYEPPWLKILLSVGLITYRMLLFNYSLRHAPVYILESNANILLQTVNSMVTFVGMAFICILFSSNTQATERKLRIANQTLHREADTDPLTQLPNRRSMLDTINLYLQNNPNEPFSVAIADIDFFKRVNDSYGHSCGDYTLKTLAGLFQHAVGDKFSVCRWGGEEFFFLLPGLNLDEASREMLDLCNAVRKLPLSFEGVNFNITITIGVAENDFRSPIQAILDEADQKLYIGKASGRDQVVV